MDSWDLKRSPSSWARCRISSSASKVKASFIIAIWSSTHRTSLLCWYQWHCYFSGLWLQIDSLTGSLIEILAFLTVLFTEGVAYQSHNLCYTSWDRWLFCRMTSLHYCFMLRLSDTFSVDIFLGLARRIFGVLMLLLQKWFESLVLPLDIRQTDFLKLIGLKNSQGFGF